MRAMLPDNELKALDWRANHRGTREADMMIGGFLEANGASWTAEERALFAALLDEQDVDIMAWAIGTLPVPDRFQGPMMLALQKLDYIRIAR